MTHQEKLAFIRAKCIEASPEILELKFGCLFQAGTSTMLYLQTESYAVNNVGFWRAHFCSKQYPMNVWEGERQPSPTRMYTGEDFEKVIKESVSRSDAFSHTFPTIEIIGRPIRLADVLLAMSKDRNGNWSPGMMEDLYALLQGQRGWKLSQDDLNEQDEATISFLYEVLK